MSLFNMVNMEEIENMTIVEYHWRMRAHRVREFHKLRDLHHQAFLNQAVTATEKKGKEVKPVYTTMNDFFNEKEMRYELLGDIYGKELEPKRKLTRQEQLILKANSL